MEAKKIVLVTGGTRGIGLGISQKFASNGYYVVICARGKPESSLFSDFGKSSLFIPCDLSKSEDRQHLVEEILEKLGRIDVLINNAGIAPPKRMDILDTTEESFELVMKINLEGSFFLTQSVAKTMITLIEKEKIQNYKPSIINISSISSFTSSPSRGEYCISKAGMSMMTRLYADRLAEYNIPVFEIQPGIIKTPMTAPVKDKYDKMIEDGVFPMARWGLPEDVANACFTLAQGMITYSTGQILNIDGGFFMKRL